MAGSVFAKLHARMGSISRKEICTNELMVQLQAFKISARFVAPNVHSRPLGPSVPSTHANGGLRERESIYTRRPTLGAASVERENVAVHDARTGIAVAVVHA